jgi:hypothetical protein
MSAATGAFAARSPGSTMSPGIDPDIQVVDVDLAGDRRLILEHRVLDGRLLEERNTQMVLRHLANLWGYRSAWWRWTPAARTCSTPTRTWSRICGWPDGSKDSTQRRRDAKVAEEFRLRKAVAQVFASARLCSSRLLRRNLAIAPRS